MTRVGVGPVVRTTAAAVTRRPRPALLLALWAVPEALPALVTGQALARAVDDGFLARRPLVGLAWLGAIAIAVLLAATGTRQAYRCLADVVEPFRDDLLRRVVTSAVEEATRPGGRADDTAVSRLTHQIEIVRDTFAGLLMTIRGSALTFGAALLGLLSLAPTLVPLVGIPMLVAVVWYLAALPTMAARQRAYVEADERLCDSAGRAAAGLRDVVACRAEGRVGESLRHHIETQAAAERGLARMTALRSMFVAAGGWLPLLLVLLTTPALVRQGLSTGAIMGTFAYLLYVLHPALHTMIRGIGGGGLRYVVTLGRVLHATNADGGREPGLAASRPGPATDGGLPPSGPATAAAGAVLSLRGVTFRYGGHAEPVVAGLNLRVPAGDHLAVIGPSGAGKSTLAGLFAGMLRAQSGEVRLDDVNLAAAAPATLVGRRVFLPQEGYVFGGSLLDNLTYLHPAASRASVDRAVSELGLDRLVRRIGGYDAVVSPALLSAGERQLIALARAYLCPVGLVVLDEATCHLDPRAEAVVEQAFAARPWTLVVIAHRISSALRARRVLVLDGAGVAVGDHQRLWSSSALYRDLVGHWQQRPPGTRRRGSAASRAAQSRGAASTASPHRSRRGTPPPGYVP
ncbi:MAG TPA: ABC transporter ATP-binding protein [Catenuloplanes sp.]